MKESFEKLKALVVKKGEAEKGNKKKIENLVVLLLIIVITVIAINSIWKEGKEQNKISNQAQQDKVLVSKQTNEVIQTSSSTLEEKLETILSKIAGVGQVSVLITYSESSEMVPMYNENTEENSTQETDKQGGSRTVEEKNSKKEVIYQEVNGEKVPITQKSINPKLEGAIVIAQGASDAMVKTTIVQAVEAVTGLATHKIQVFESKE